jgi:hypothetical protein
VELFSSAAVSSQVEFMFKLELTTNWEPGDEVWGIHVQPDWRRRKCACIRHSASGPEKGTWNEWCLKRLYYCKLKSLASIQHIRSHQIRRTSTQSYASFFLCSMLLRGSQYFRQHPTSARTSNKKNSHLTRLVCPICRYYCQSSISIFDKAFIRNHRHSSYHRL